MTYESHQHLKKKKKKGKKKKQHTLRLRPLGSNPPPHAKPVPHYNNRLLSAIIIITPTQNQLRAPKLVLCRFYFFI